MWAALPLRLVSCQMDQNWNSSLECLGTGGRFPALPLAVHLDMDRNQTPGLDPLGWCPMELPLPTPSPALCHVEACPWPVFPARGPCQEGLGCSISACPSPPQLEEKERLRHEEEERRKRRPPTPPEPEPEVTVQPVLLLDSQQGPGLSIADG